MANFNVDKPVFQAITRAAQSEQAITAAERAQIEKTMAKGGLDPNEQAILKAIDQGTQFTLSYGQQHVTLDPHIVSFPTVTPDPEREPLDKAFFLRLAELSPEALEAWYTEHAEANSRLQAAYNQLDPVRTSDRETLVALESVGNRLQALQDRGSSGWAQRHYQKRSTHDIAKELVERVVSGTNAQQTQHVGKEAALKDIAEDLRLLAASPHKNARALEAHVYEGLRQALRYEDPNPYGKFQTIAWHELGEAVSELTGPGSGVAKAHFLKLAMETYKDPIPGVLAEKLLRSDPNGVVKELEYMSERSREDRQILDKALGKMMHHYADKPDEAADALGTILGTSAREYAEAALAEPPDMETVSKLSHQVGYLLRASEQAVAGLGKAAKKKIDQGAFIARVFTKGVSMLSGVKQIDSLGKKGIDFLKGREYKQVDQWEKGITSSYRDLMQQIFLVREPNSGAGSAAMEAFKDRQNIYETAFRQGYENHQDEEHYGAQRKRL
jgi:hypothetical protein